MSDIRSSSPGAGPKPTLPLVAALLAIVAIAAIWLIAVPIGPDVCALVMPAPRNCFLDHRAHNAVAPTIALAITALAILVASAAFPRARRVVGVAGVVAVLLLGAIAAVLVAWIPALA